VSFVDQNVQDGLPRIAAVVLGVLASPLSIALGLAILWPYFALVFAMVALPFCIIVGIPAGLLARPWLELSFFHCTSVGGIAGLSSGLVIMAVAAIQDWYYDIATSFFILVLAGAICGGIAFPWTRWLDRGLSTTSAS